MRDLRFTFRNDSWSFETKGRSSLLRACNVSHTIVLVQFFLSSVFFCAKIALSFTGVNPFPPRILRKKFGEGTSLFPLARRSYVSSSPRIFLEGEIKLLSIFHFTFPSSSLPPKSNPTFAILLLFLGAPFFSFFFSLKYRYFITVTNKWLSYPILRKRHFLLQYSVFSA